MKLYNKQEYKKQNCLKEIDVGLRELRKLKIGLKRMKSDLEEFTDNDDEENDSFFVTSYDSRSDNSEKHVSGSKSKSATPSVMKSHSLRKRAVQTPQDVEFDKHLNDILRETGMSLEDLNLNDPKEEDISHSYQSKKGQ